MSLYFKENKKKIFLILFIVFLFCSSFILSLFPIRMSHWWDETVYLQHAEIFFSGRDNYSELSFRPPLLSILFFFAFFIKHSIVSASIVTALFGALLPVFGFLIGRKLYDFKTGIISGLILSVAPFINLNANYLLTDVPATVLIAISFYLILFKNRTLLLFLSGVFFSLAILMKFTAILIGLVFLVYFFIAKFKIKEMLVFFLGSAIIILPYFIWAQINFGFFLTPFIKGSQMVGDFNESLFFYFKEFNRAFTPVASVGLFFLLVRYLYMISNRKIINCGKDFLLFFWIILYFLYLTSTPHKELRYIIPISIPVIILSSRGYSFLFELFEKYKLILVFLCIILFSSLLVLVHSNYSYQNITKEIFVDKFISDEMKLSTYLLEEKKYSGIIYINQRYPVIAYYSGLETRQIWPSDENFYFTFLDQMKDPGLIIGMFGVKVPQPSWLDKNPHFEYVNEIGDFFIYS